MPHGLPMLNIVRDKHALGVELVEFIPVVGPRRLAEGPLVDRRDDLVVVLGGIGADHYLWRKGAAFLLGPKHHPVQRAFHSILCGLTAST